MSGDDLKAKLVRGTGVNVIGIIAKSLTPAFFIIVTRLYGPAVFGVYLIADTIIKLATSFAFSGFQDGVLLFASRHVHDEREHGVMYEVMANALVIVGALCALLIAVALTVGPGLVAWRFPQEGAADAVRIMALSLPLLAIPQLVISATKALMIMRYDAILIGFLQPLFQIVLSVVFYFTLDRSVVALATAAVLANALLTVVAVVVFTKHFSLAELGRSVRRFRYNRDLVSFSIPQNLNLTLVYFLPGVSVLLMGMFGLQAELIAFYGTGAEIVRTFRQIRLVFSAAFTPVIARLWKEKRISELEGHYAMLTRWIVLLAVPIILSVLAFKEKLLPVFHSSYTMGSSFMSILALSAFVAAAFGLSGNIIVMAGKPKWNLYNSIVNAFVSVGLNALLIPRWGLDGAAAATAFASILAIALNTWQANFWLEIRLHWHRIHKPFVAGVVSLAAYVGAGLLPVSSTWALGSMRVAAALLFFVAALALLGIDPEDRQLFTYLRRGRGAQQEASP